MNVLIHIHIFIYIYNRVCILMSNSFEEFIVILKSLKFKVNNHAQATPAYILMPYIFPNIY